LVWVYDRSYEVKWVGGTNLEVRFIVTNSESGQGIANAEVQVRCEMGFYEGVEEDFDKTILLHTDATGIASRQCCMNRIIGTQSRLLFTNTYQIYIPRWQVRVLATGYETIEGIELMEEYRGKAVRVGPEQNLLVVPVSLRKRAK
jgi:hypothetical protein